MAVLWAIIAVLAVAVLFLASQVVRSRRPRIRGEVPPTTRRILFPFVAHGLAPRALDAALRLAHAEDASLVPVFLARVPLYLPLDAALPRQSAIAIPLQEAIEQRAAVFGVPVDSRIERGRSYRHALRMTMEHEQFDRMVIAAAGHGPGLDAEDVSWVLDNAPGEIVVLRPDPDHEVDVPDRNGRPPRRRRVLTMGSRPIGRKEPSLRG